MEKRPREEDQIDLLEIFFAFKRRLLWIVGAALLGGILAGLYTKLLVTPQYQSTTTLLVLTKETTLSSLADLQMGSQLTNDYEILTVSRQVLEQTIEELNLPLDYEELKSAVSINNPEDSRIMEITVTYPDPGEAKEIVDTIAQITSDFIGDKMEGVPPKIIDEGDYPENPSSPNTMRNLCEGVLLGLVLSCGVITVMTVMDDTIKSEADIETYLGLPTLASVPDRRDYIGGKKRKNGKRKISQNTSDSAKKARKA